MGEWLEWIVKYGWFIGIPLLFLIIVIYVYRPKRRKRYRKDAEIPFEDKDERHD